MKLRTNILILLILCGVTSRLSAQTSIEESQRKFSEARFGIFLHWGLYATFAQGEWYMQNADIDKNEYAKAMNAFYPHDFEAASWVSAFKDAGAKYICLTSRHHDGFSMWDTAQSDYNIMHTPFRRDVVGELAQECHKQDIGFHLYYSHIDWTRDDYPTGRTGRHTGKDPEKENWATYYDFMNRQLEELLTRYGKIGAIWFDGMWDHDNDSVAFDWQLQGQYDLIHRLQPACLVGNNHHQTPFPGENIQIFERDVPGENHAGLSGQSVSRLPLETCQTMNGMWGYKVADQNYKSATELIRLLVRTSGKGANLLLNIGPQPDGNLPAMALTRLKEIGAWLRLNGETIYGSEAGPVGDGVDIVSTAKKRHIYVHVLNDTIAGDIELVVPYKVRKVTAFGKNLRLKHKKKGNILTIPVAECQETVPDRIIDIEIEEAGEQ